MAEFDVEGARKEGYSDEEIARHLADKNNIDYDAAVNKGGYKPHEIIQQFTGVGPGQSQVNPITSSPVSNAVAGAGVGLAGAATRYGLGKSINALGSVFGSGSQAAAAAAMNPNSATGLQAYLDSQLFQHNINPPISEVEKFTGQRIASPSEAQAAIKKINGSPAKLVDDIRNVNGQWQYFGQKVQPPIAPMDVTPLKTKFAIPQAPTTAVGKMVQATPKIAQSVLKHAMPVVAGAGIGYDLQDALNRWNSGEEGRAIVSGLGAIGSAASLIPTPYTRGIGTAVSVGAPLLNAYLDSQLGHEKTPPKEKPASFSYGLKEGGAVSEMKAALKMKNGGLYENIHAKQERIAHGSGEHMHKPGSKGAPSEQDFIESAKTAKMKEGGLSLSVGRGEKLPVSQGAGLTAKGREKYNRETGSHLQAPQPEGGARKDSFCARMQGVVDHAKGDAERAKASLKRWKC